MNKAGLTNAIAEAVGMPKVEAKRVLEAMIAAIQDALRNGEKVALSGFGTFTVTERAERKGRNPNKNAENSIITIPAKRIVKFKTSSELSETL